MTYFNGVKQLEWEYPKSVFVEATHSEHAFGYYEIVKQGSEHILYDGFDDLGVFGSQREAQEFAQQLFNKAVMSCVEIEDETYQR